VDQKEKLKHIDQLLSSIKKKKGASNEVNTFINQGGAINLSSSDGMTLSHMAAKVGDKTVLSVLLNANCEINRVDAKGYTPLHYAILNKNQECVKLILQNGSVDLSLASFEKELPVHLAMRLSLSGIVSDIKQFEKAMEDTAKGTWWVKPKGTIDSNGVSIIHLAAKFNNFPVESLPFGLDVNVMDSMGNTPLHYAALYTTNSGLITEMIKKLHMNPNQCNHLGFTPFHYCCAKGDMQAVQVMIENGGDIDGPDYFCGVTPTHLLASQIGPKNLEAFKKLLPHIRTFCTFMQPDRLTGTNPSKILEAKNVEIKEDHNANMFYYCEIGDVKKVIDLIESDPKSLKMVDYYGNTLLHYACLSDEKDLIFHLVNKRIDINVQNNNHKSAVHYAFTSNSSSRTVLKEAQDLLSMQKAAETNSVVMLKELFRSTPNLNPSYQNFDNGDTVVHIAVQSNAIAALSFLLENNAQLKENNDKRTPLHIAAMKTSVSCLKILVECDGISKIIHSKDKNGDTALHLWCKYVQTQTQHIEETTFDPGVNLLMSYGASEKDKNSEGKTPEDIGKNKNDEVLKRSIYYHVHGKELIRALSSGNAVSMENLIQKVQGENIIKVATLVNYRDKDLKTPLHWAAEGAKHCIDRLIKEGADPKARDKTDALPNLADVSNTSKEEQMLISYCANGNLSLAESILKKQKFPGKFLMNISTAFKETPLYCACVGGLEHSESPLQPGGWPSIVAMLLKYYLNIDHRTLDGNTAVHGAAKYANSKCLELLLAFGGEVEDENNAKCNALDLVPIKKEEEADRKKRFAYNHFFDPNEIKMTFKLLLQQKRLKRLHIACQKGDSAMLMEVIEAIKKGTLFAELSKLMNKLMNEPNEVKTGNLSNKLDVWRNKAEIHRTHVELLKSIVNAKYNNTTALEIAVRQLNHEIVTILMEERADPLSCDYNALVPNPSVKDESVRIFVMQNQYGAKMCSAALEGDHQTITDLLAQIKKEETENPGIFEKIMEYHPPHTGFTPLHCAVFGDKIQTVKLLLDNGAKVSTKERIGGNTAIHLAALMGHHHCLEALIQVDITSLGLENDNAYHPLLLSSLYDSDDYQTCLKKLATISDLKKKTSHNQTPLIISAKCGNLKNIQILVNQGCDVNVIDDYHRTPLLYAISQQNWTKTVPFLIENGADVNVSDPFGDTPIILACRKGNLTLLNQLLQSKKTINFDAVNELGMTALHEVVMNRSLECLKALVENGANVNAKWTARIKSFILLDNVTPLVLAVFRNCSKEMFRHLILHGAEVNVNSIVFMGIDIGGLSDWGVRNTYHLNGYAWASLIVELRKGETVKVHKNIKHLTAHFKEWLDCIDESREGLNRTALHWAVISNDYSAVENLLRLGAKTDIQDLKGKTALDLADGDPQMIKIFEDRKNGLLLENKINQLLVQDPKTNIVEEFSTFLSENNTISLDGTIIKNGSTALHIFAKEGRRDLVNFALLRGSSISKQNEDGDTPLHLAVRYGKTKVVARLFKENPDTDIENSRGETVKSLIQNYRKNYAKYLSDEGQIGFASSGSSDSEHDDTKPAAKREKTIQNLENLDILSRADVLNIEKKILAAIEKSRNDGKILSEEDIKNLRMAFEKELLLTNQITRRENALREEMEKEKKEKEAKRENERITTSKKKEAAEKKEDWKELKSYEEELNTQNNEILISKFESTWKSYDTFCVNETANEELLPLELKRLKALLDKIRLGDPSMEFLFKEVVEILHYLSTSTSFIKCESLKDSMYNLNK